ncbi:MAG: response regulator transcription factor [Erysipelotrichaceae bacterium]|nr:response regulator transcription factor [Erysipelotrichaceae bacterium]MBQ1511980.1 response regulator transcription factor [Erysipelotrichaceae bacterium]MBQ5756455.1 response regulator transcription factor [Erysipelotrichaceae bacterium]
MVNILICDDETDIVNALKIYLSDPEYTLFTAANGKEAVEITENNEIHLILMDIMMPVMDGITAMAKIREKHNLPIILLTAKSEDTDKILGLNVGADDYITKPFNPLEVSARVRSQLRRYLKLGGGNAGQEILSIGGIELNDLSKEVTVDGNPVSLTPKEYEILKFLMSNPGQVFSPKEIYSTVWKEKPYGADNTVAVHIRHLREKLEIDPADPRYIKVIFGQGYKFEKGRVL